MSGRGRKKRGFGSAAFSGFLDLLVFLAALAMTAGYALIGLAKLKVPDGLGDFWGKLTDGVDKMFAGKFGDLLAKLPDANVAGVIVFGALALLFLIMMIGGFRQGGSILKKGGCAFAGVLALILFAAFGVLFAEHFISSAVALKWYVLAPCGFLLLQMILKFSAYARAY